MCPAANDHHQSGRRFRVVNELGRKKSLAELMKSRQPFV